MSVETEADRELNKAKVQVHGAASALAKLVVDHVDGTKQFTDAYRLKCRLALMSLLDIEASIGEPE